MKRKAWPMALVLSTLLAPLPAQSFWSRYKIEVHQRITASALSEPFLVGTKSLEFTNNAIKALQDGVQLPDIPDKMGYSPTDHFDSEGFVGSLAVLKKRRAQLISMLSDDAYANQADAWEHLGLIFHAIQDFYSHSTWVRINSAGTANFASLTETTATAPNWAKRESEIGDVCLADRVTYPLPSGKVTTGYFPPFETGAGKCDHGSVEVWFANCLLNDLFKVNHGLALDSQCSVSRDARSLQESARARAEAETRGFTQAIIKQLVDAKEIEGACALMGVPVAECPIELPTCNPTPDWETAFRYRITQRIGLSSNDYVGVGGGRSQKALRLDMSSGSPPRLRLSTPTGLDTYQVSLHLRSTTPYIDTTSSYTLEGVGAELWNSLADSCLLAEFVMPASRRGCFAFSGTLKILKKQPLCTRDGVLFSDMEISYEGDSPVKEYGADALGPVKIDNTYGKGVFAECLRGTPISTGGFDNFTCSSDEDPVAATGAAH